MIKIVSDSGCDLDAALAKEYGIDIIPISYTFDGNTYYECGKELSDEEFFARERQEANPPKTTQITPLQYEEFFTAKIGEGFDTIIYVSISANGSGMHQNALMVARELNEEKGADIRVVDGRSFTMAYGYPTLMAAKMARAGKSADDIVAALEKALASSHVYFLVGDLTHLKKGGRINAATLAVANMLDLKPVLTIEDGLVVQHGKIRGEKKAFKKLLDAVEEEHSILGRHCYFVAHSCVPDKAQALREELASRIGDEKIRDVAIGQIIGTHAGPDVCALGFFDTEVEY